MMLPSNLKAYNNAESFLDQPIVVIDLECENHTTPYSKVGAPWMQDDYVVTIGSKRLDGELKYHRWDSREGWEAGWDNYLRSILEGVGVVIAHNAGYEFRWMAESKYFQEWSKAGGMLWCTMMQEAANRGWAEHSLMCSLGDCANRYGGTDKLDEVKLLWQEGVLTSDIDEDLLKRYLMGDAYCREEGQQDAQPGDVLGDILNTELIFNAQMKVLQDRSCLEFRTSYVRHQGAHALYYMDWLGVPVNQEVMENNIKVLQEELDQRTVEQVELTPKGLPFTFNPGSGRQVGALMYGGGIPYKKRMLILDEQGIPVFTKKTTKVPMLDAQGNQTRFKSGKQEGELRFRNETGPDYSKPKSRLEDCVYCFPGLLKPSDLDIEGSPPKEGKQPYADGRPSYQSGGAWTLIAAETLASKGVTGEEVSFLQGLAAVAEVSKDLTTFHIGPQAGIAPDGRIHNNHNTSNTKTGRVSSSGLFNSQNLSRVEPSSVREGKMKGIARRWISGTHLGRTVVEPDYSGLENFGAAINWADTDMMKDLEFGLELHTMSLSWRAPEIPKEFEEEWKRAVEYAENVK